MSSDDDELMREFLVESRDNLNQLDQDFVALEQNPRDPKLLGAIFRCVHTIKGTAGFLGLSKLEALTHIGESQLSRLRDGALTLDGPLTSTLLSMVDAIRNILSTLEATGAEGEQDVSAVVESLSRIGKASEAPVSVTAQLEPLALESPTLPRPMPAPVIEVAIEAAPVTLPTPTSDGGSGEPSAKAGSVADTAIRVDVGLLDRVMNLVGELVLARNQILQYGINSKDAGFVNATQRLNLLTTELQAGVMKTRMQPIGNVWHRFPRIVRDLAHVCGKRVTLELDGTETELDRSIIEAIKDPLTHAVRNAVDHGIENPERRVAAGKPATGRILLRAYHEGGQVNIEVSDDGGGLPIEKVRARAVERSLVTAERAARMTEREVAQLIFLPGFSTAEQVTNVSGRGVGMDVVKTNIEKIGGIVDISSRPGQGTTLKIKIPLTLAIIPALVVTSAGERFAIPQVNLLELVRLEGAQALRGIESLHGTNVYRLRGNLLPLVFLNRALRLPSEERNDVCNIVVLQADDRQFGLVVDGISDTEEIVVKPLGKELKGISSFAGATIMGDGKVALILDVLGIAQRANVVSSSRDRGMLEAGPELAAEHDRREALLLFRVGSSTRMALPLWMVARLEEVSREKIEHAAGRDVVQYRGAILPLIMLNRTLLHENLVGDASQPLQVIVYSEQGRSVGLVVEQILDVVEEAVTVRSQASRDGVLGSAVIQGRVTDLLDVHGVIRRFDANFFDRREVAA